MAVRHDETVVAHNGFAFAGGASVDGGALADGGVVADEDVGLLPFELEVLRDSSHYCGGEDMAVLADACAFEDSGIGVNDGACTDFHVFVNVHERTDLYRGVQFGFRMDEIHVVMFHITNELAFWTISDCRTTRGRPATDPRKTHGKECSCFLIRKGVFCIVSCRCQLSTLLRSCLQHWVLKVCPGRRAIMRPWIRHPSSDMSPMRSSSLWREGSFW